ncbi:MAG: 16S rRNA (cytosine(1402)-N(4))-methyltransferase RsmH [Clostridia bacterium]|nr:16S rRNA (cytosine(1402)-N(4))-methyltransferase RsmH [Clostridia bacterium]
MSENFVHIPVLFNQCMDGLNIKPDGVYIDCTAGGGGHSSGILDRLSDKGKLISLDKDDEALAECERKKSERGASNWFLVKTDYSQLDEAVHSLDIDKVDGILADLGVSSHQIDIPERGFSYATDGPLDMRMDTTQSLTAAKVVNTYKEEELARIFKVYGEERYSGRIAAGIVRDRRDNPFTSTIQLADRIVSYIPGKGRNEQQHPARRCFQAIRIEVNHELQSVEELLDKGPELLNSEGRFAVITFHSLEDRLVKDKFKLLENPCTCPREFPVCICGKKPIGKVITHKPIIADEEENKINFRAHSAKLRIFEKNAK